MTARGGTSDFDLPEGLASVRWRGRDLKLLARHYVAATAQVSRYSVEELLAQDRRQPLARWRQTGIAAALRCPQLGSPTVGWGFMREHSTVIHARDVIAKLEAENAEPIRDRLAKIHAKAMELAAAEMGGAR